MFAVACAAVCIAGPIHGPRWEVVRATSRYDVFLVKPSPGAPPEVRHKVKNLAILVGFLQQHARGLWYRGLMGGDPVRDAMAVHDMLQASRDTVSAVQALDYPAGMAESYWIQVGLLDALTPVCAGLRNNPTSPWARQLPAQLEATRIMLRIAFRPFLQLTQ